MTEVTATIAMYGVFVLVGVVVSGICGFHVENLASALAEIKAIKRSDGSDVVIVSKRYTEFQNEALEYCTGICMYRAGVAYGECYDLCNWNGQGSSPWFRLVKERVGRPLLRTVNPANWPTAMANRTGQLKDESKQKYTSSSRGRKSGPANGKLKMKPKMESKYDVNQVPKAGRYNTCKS